MASKAYIASMTVAELSSELKQRGLSCRGKKKALQSRLEEALENEEMSESSSDDGREATIRAASAVISQLEGDGSVNNYSMIAATNTTLTTPIPQEELVVSIDSRRLPQQTVNTRNGDDEKLQSGGKSAGSVEQGDLDVPVVPMVDHIPSSLPPPATTITNNINTVEDVSQAEDKVPVSAPAKTVIQEQNPSINELSSTTPTVTVEVAAPIQPDQLESQQTHPPVQQASTQQHDVDNIIPEEVKVTDEPVPPPSLPSDSVASPTTESSQSSSPPKQHSPNAPHVLPLSSTTPTVDRSGFLMPTGFMSPMDTDGESEVNSVAVEPPSPNRDDVSFVADDGNTSISGSVDLMDVTTPSEGGGVVLVPLPTPEDTVSTVENMKITNEEQVPVQAKVTPATDDVRSMTDEQGTTTPPESKPDTSNDTNNDDSADKVRQEDQKVGVSSQSGLDLGTIEVDVLVPTVEEEDMSVFSAEAAEVQKLDNKVLKKPDTLFENDGIDTTTTTNMRSLSASDRTTESVGGVLDSCTNGSKKRTISVPEENRKDRERSGTPTTKRRRISTSPKRAQERRRKWGSSTSRTPTAAPTAISSDILENIIPDEVKEEVSEHMANMSGLEAVMIYEDETNPAADEREGDKNDEQLKQITEEQPSSEQQPINVGRNEDGEEIKPVEEEDILDIGKESSMMDEYEQEWKEKEQEREEQRKESMKAKQELETRRRIEARVRARQQQEKLEEKDKPVVVRRTPSPARNPPSRMIHIVNLTRPFTNTQLKDLLQNGEDVLVERGCWTDRIKSHCIAVFLTMESAIAARNRIHNLKWPRQNPRLLKADYLTPKEVYEYSNGELEIQASSSDNEHEDKMAVDEEQVITKEVEEPVKSQQPQVMADRRRESVQEKKDHAEVNRSKPRLSSSNDKEEPKEEKKPKSMLDKLFRKTQATPPIYWLPLTEKEVKEKEAQREAEEAERQKRRDERRRERELEDQAREKKLREEREERAKERMRRRRERSESRSHSPRSRRRSRSPRRRTPIRRGGHSPRRSRSPVRRRQSTRSRSYSPR